MGQSNPGRIPKMPRGARCPICTAPAEPATRPFCSVRCSEVDLSRWMRGAYAIPGGQQDSDEDGDEAQVAQQSGGSERKQEEE